MNIENSAQRILSANSPSPELLERTLELMREASWTELEQAPLCRKKKHTGLRRLAISLSAVASVMVLLIGTNAFFPAFAESLPFIGEVFETFNQGAVSDNMREVQHSLNDYAVPAGENTVQVPAGGLGQSPVTVSVDQVYYDGVFVYAGLIMEVDGCSDTVYSNSWSGYYNVLLNGDPQVQWDEDTREYVSEDFYETTASGWWQKVEDGKYISQRGFRVPEKYQDLDRLEVTLCSQGIEDGATGLTRLVNNTPFQLSFTVEKNNAVVQKIQGPVEMNGITLLSAEAGPAGSTFTFSVSGQYNNPAQVIRFDDGRSLGAAGAGKTAELADGGERQTWFMGGLQSDEDRKVVLGLLDKNDTDEYIAVFVLDFQKGAVEAGTPEDIKEPPYASYVCGTENVEGLTDGMLVSAFEYGEEKNRLWLLTSSAYQELTVELWQDGQWVGSATTQNDGLHWSPEPYYMEYVPQSDGSWTVEWLKDIPLNQYQVSFEWQQGFDPALPALVKVIDPATGEVVLEQNLEWNQPRSNDPRIVRPEIEDDITKESSDGAVSSQAG